MFEPPLCHQSNVALSQIIGPDGPCPSLHFRAIPANAAPRRWNRRLRQSSSPDGDTERPVSCCSRREPRKTAILALALSQVLPRPPAPDLVLFNGNVITVDRNFSIAEAVAIAGDRFMAVGSERSDAHDRGPVDPHDRSEGPDGHSRADGQPSARRRRRARRRPVARAHRSATSRAAVGARVRQSKPGDVIVSNSDWHEAQLKEQRLPLRDDLDTIAPHNPVVLVRGGHEYILNSAALARWNITRRRRSRPAAASRGIADGRLNGELVDTAKALVTLPPPAPRTLDQRIDDRIAEYKKLQRSRPDDRPPSRASRSTTTACCRRCSGAAC